ncbi:MAG TPA: UDP-3-O-(3-hydroxymyristoyl)glucosamine N-acyltransferase [bacterium]|nr:UDP-3-O-(3-hydroxymyristoyl)glucosamine N-acyltransferase [bacterium]
MKASDIARFLNSELTGEDIEVVGVCSLNNPKDNHLAFLNFNTFTFIGKTFATVLLLIQQGTLPVPYAMCIPVDNPRLAHAKVTAKYFIEPERMIPKGDGILQAHPYHGVTIYDCVKWGKDCFFKPGAVIGHSGFGYERDENNVPILRPHLGGVKIGDSVTVGANSIVARGTFDDTVIGDNVKIDDLVHIPHNCVIGDNTIITAGSIIGGSVTIGKNCWLGLNCTIMQRIKIGDNVTIGIGANIVKDVPDGATYAGFMARPLEEMRGKK